MEISKRWNRQTCTCPQWGFNISSSGGLYQYHQYPSSTDPDNNESPPDEGIMVQQMTGRSDGISIAEQDGKQIFVGVANVGEIDAVSSVPHLPTTINGRDGTTLLRLGHHRGYRNGALAAATRSVNSSNEFYGHRCFKLHAQCDHVVYRSCWSNNRRGENNSVTVRIRPSEFLVLGRPIDRSSD